MHHSLLLLENGDVLAFGCNEQQQCLVPAWPPGSRAVEVAAGTNHSLVLKREQKTRRGKWENASESPNPPNRAPN
eukprot:1477318-Amphidinium_carterae.1